MIVVLCRMEIGGTSQGEKCGLLIEKATISITELNESKVAATRNVPGRVEEMEYRM